MKIVLIGGGSYVFAPTVLADTILKHKMSGCELVLVDLELEAARAMAGVGRKMAESIGIKIDIRASNKREEALPNADYVIVSAAIQGFRRWTMDYEILRDCGIPDQARENGGVGGLAYSIRSISLVMGICRDMERLCPQAVLLDVTNPMPRVITAVKKYSSIDALGFCNIAWRGAKGYEWLALLLGKEMNEIHVTTAGLNHFAWLLEIHDLKSGEDLLPQVIKKVENGEGRELRVIRKWYDQFGGIAAGHVDHHGEYLPFDPDIHYAASPPFHGDAGERKQRMMELNEIAAGRKSWASLLEKGSWEHPVDVAAAAYLKMDQCFDIMNLPNRGYIGQIPEGRIVEVPARMKNGKLQGEVVPPLPEKVAALCNEISNVHELAAEAAVTGSRKLAAAAIEQDPAVTDKKAALTALDRMLEVHRDILPQFL